MAWLRRRAATALALAAAFISAAAAVSYTMIMRAQQDRPAVWFIAALVVSTALGVGGAARFGPSRRASLIACGTVLMVLGVLSILSIGPMLLIAGMLALVAAMSVTRSPTPRAHSSGRR